MDEIIEPTIWRGDDKKYYPAGVASKTPPTFLTFPEPFSATRIKKEITGCGMNIPKAKALNYLAQTFATASATETSLTVKTAGGLEVGIGVLGKLSIGDNNTLTTLLQAVVSQVVKRLTVALGVPILEAIDIQKVEDGDQENGPRLTAAKISPAARAEIFSAAFARAR